MARHGWGWGWKLAGAISVVMGGAIAPSARFTNATIDCAQAQIVPDATLGSESSVVAPLAPGVAIDQIEGCPGGGKIAGDSKFIVTGRGGLPPNPREPLSGEAVLTNWATLSGAGSREQGAGSREQRSKGAEEQIVEATGWVIGSKGEVILTAIAPTIAANDIPWLQPTTCHTP